jgi:hypothetical protein
MRARHDFILLTFLARNCLIGIATGWLLLAGMLYLDVASLGYLLFTSDQWLVALILIGSGFGLTFGGLAMSTAIFLLPKD